jgi:hypothetical protein
MMLLRRLPLLFLAILVVSSCDGDDLSLAIDPPPPALTTDELIIADCYVVRDALEAYAADNGGEYPGYPGPPFTPYLPGNNKLPNRYTGRSTLPIFGAPNWPGEIGVIVFFDESSDATGYRVIGRGRYGELVRLENISRTPKTIVDGYALVLENVDSLLAALDVFFAQSGYYPSDLADDLPSGETLIDLRPGGHLMYNPVLLPPGCFCEPVDGAGLGVPGGIGYVGIDRNGDGLTDDFGVEAYGYDYEFFVSRTRQSLEDEWVRISYELLRAAVELFASENGGVFPRDLDADQTPAGDTLRDLITRDYLNPYTNASAYRNGLATSRGEVGYQSLEYNGVVVGYVINALGLFEEELERFEVTN